MKADFDRRYRGEYLRAWERFALDFERGRELLRGRGEWVSAVDELAGSRNPYFNLLDVMDAQLAPFKDEALPDWAQLVFYYQEMRAFAPGQAGDDSARNNVLTKLGLKLIGKAGAAGKAVAGAGKSALKTKKKLDKASAKGGKGPDERALVLEEAGTLLGDYQQALTDIAFNADARSVSYSATVNLFSNPDNPGKGEGPEARAHDTIKRLQTLIGKETRHNRAFWAIYTGPMNVVGNYMLEETACYLQDQWQNGFLTELEGVSPYKLAELMFGDGGKLWGFMDSELRPFVTRRLKAGYVPVRAHHERIPFTPAFLEFASRGRDSVQAKRDRYPVLVESLPTGSNRDARYHPNKTALLLQCPAGDQTVVNYNFPVSRQLNWAPDCGRVVLAIDVGRYTLEKVYGGPLAFAEFLSDFRLGRKRLLPSEFPELEQTLAEFGIEYLDVEFGFRGHADVVALLDQVRLDPPRQLAACWD